MPGLIALNQNLKQERVYRDMHKTMYIYADNNTSFFIINRNTGREYE